MSRRKPTGLPDYCNQLPSGRYRVQVKDPVTGKRLSANKVDPREPDSFETPADVWAAHARVTALLQQRMDRNETVSGFFEQWTDPEHYRWGKHRSEQSMQTYRSGMRKFVEMYGDRLIASITPLDFDDYLATRPAQSNVVTVGMFFRDAVRARKRLDDPTEGFDLDRPVRVQEEAPEPALLHAMHLYARNSKRIPDSLHEWLLIGSETGMRTGELDAMHVDKLDLSDPDRPLYTIDRQFHDKLGALTTPKHNSVRTILLPPTIVPVVRRLAATAHERGGWLLTNPTNGKPWNKSSRDWYWSKLGEHSLRLRLATASYPQGVSMKAATRVFFATQMVLSAPHQIPAIALHYGHKDKGVTLLKHYTRLTDAHGQAGMAEIYAAMPPVQIPADVVNLDDRRKS